MRPKRFELRSRRMEGRVAPCGQEQPSCEDKGMGVVRKVALGVAAYRAYRKGRAMGEETVRKQWDAQKSVGKANQAAVGAAQATVAGAGGVAALLALMRTIKPGMLPWDEESDKTLVAAAAIALGPLWAWLRTFFRDKLKHEG